MTSHLSLSDRLRLVAHWLSEKGWPRFITEAMQYLADLIEC